MLPPIDGDFHVGRLGDAHYGQRNVAEIMELVFLAPISDIDADIAIAIAISGGRDAGGIIPQFRTAGTPAAAAPPDVTGAGGGAAPRRPVLGSVRGTLLLPLFAFREAPEFG